MVVGRVEAQGSKQETLARGAGGRRPGADFWGSVRLSGSLPVGVSPTLHGGRWGEEVPGTCSASPAPSTGQCSTCHL
jgi:hypothetical protein